MVPGAMLLLVGVVPAYWCLVQWPTVLTMTLVQCFIALGLMAYSGPLPAAMAELFPVKLRGLGLSLSYSLGVTVFGGFVPMASQFLIGRTGLVIAPAFVLMAAAVISALSLWPASRYGLHPSTRK